MSRRAAVGLGIGVGATAAGFGQRSAEAAVPSTDDEPSPLSTLDRTIVRGRPDARGWRRHVLAAGERHVVREDLAAAGASRGVGTPIAAFVHLTDVHVQDDQSPVRFEFIGRYRDRAGVPQYGGSYRPHDVLTAQVADSSVRAVRALAAGPVTGLPFGFAVSTGDAADSCQHNELRRSIDVLDGGTIVPDSGRAGVYEGVGDGGDPFYWHPEGTRTDEFRSRHGFPTVHGLLAAAMRPFDAAGLGLPWYAVHGNHEGVVRGGFERSDALAELALGGRKPVRMTGSLTAPEFVDRLMGGDAGVLKRLAAEEVTADPGRRLVSRTDLVAEHFATSGSPIGHGFTPDNLRDGTAYYAVDLPGTAAMPVRMVVLDSVNEHGDGDGSIDGAQFAWLRRTLAEAPHRLTVIASHHTTASMDNRFAGRDRSPAPRVLGPEVVRLLLQHPQVVLWVDGHVHRNAITAHRAEGRAGGFWEVTTASHIDWPQQTRAVEIAHNGDGTLSIFTTLIDTAATAVWDGSLATPLSLASLSREIAANDPARWQRPRVDDELFRGAAGDRNAELLVPAPPGLDRAPTQTAPLSERAV